MSELEIATANHIHVMEQLDAAKRTASGGVEYWHARDLMRVLGYTTWQNFQAAIRRATDAMRETGVDPSHQVMQTHRPITGGKGAVQIAEDFFVTRGAAYLIAMNGDPTKPEVAAAQAYFAEQARENELAKQEAADVKRLRSRERVSEAVKRVNDAAKDVGVTKFGIFSDAGVRGFYGMSSKELAELKGLPEGETLYNRAGSLELAGNAFRMELAAERLVQDGIGGEERAIRVNREVGAQVRETVKKQLGRGPEALPLEPEPIKHVKARVLGRPTPKSLSKTR